MSDATVHASLEYDDQGRPVVLTSDRRADRPRTDWARLEAMTDEENRTNAESDPDAVILTDEQRRGLRPVPNPRDIRENLGLSQNEFSRRFDIPLGTLRDWEQGRRSINATARTLLRTIAEFPDIVEFANAPHHQDAEAPQRSISASDLTHYLISDGIATSATLAETFRRLVLNTYLPDLDEAVSRLAMNAPAPRIALATTALTELRHILESLPVADWSIRTTRPEDAQALSEPEAETSDPMLRPVLNRHP